MTGLAIGGQRRHMERSAVGRVPPGKRSSLPDAASFETILMPMLFVAAALCVVAALAIPVVVSLVPALARRRS